MAFITSALHGELVGLQEVLDGTWRLSYRCSALYFLDVRSGPPVVMADPVAKKLLEQVEDW